VLERIARKKEICNDREKLVLMGTAVEKDTKEENTEP
jgi:hypothetical protein